MSLLARFLARVAPINTGDGTLEDIIAAVTAPGEIYETLARETSTHSAWGKALDPDQAPAPLLPWLALFPGVRLQPADTEAQQRYRIKQAAGLYRCTPRAVVEELQLALTGTKTVLLGFHTPDEWHYTVATIDAETPDADAVERAILAQKPVGMLAEVLLTADWSYFVLGPTLVATRVGDEYTIGAPTYPDYASIVAAFSDYQHVEDNDPDL